MFSNVGCGAVLGMCALLCDGRPEELSQQKPPLVVLAPLLASVVRQGSCPLRAGSAPHRGNPFAMTLIFLSSWRSMCSRLRSTKRVFVVTRAPASRHMRPAARSKGPPRARRNSPDCAQAARWSPRESKVRRHRQKRADKGSGRRKRLKRSRRKR